MVAINFTLTSFDTDMDMAIAAAIASQDPSAPGYAPSATAPRCVYNVSTQVMQNAFRIGFDSADIANGFAAGNGAAGSDIKYYQHFSVTDVADSNYGWPQTYVLNVAHSMCDDLAQTGHVEAGTEAVTLFVTDRASVLFDQNKMLMKHDSVRYLAKEIFTSHHGADLFNNETELQEDVQLQGQNLWLNNIKYRFEYLDIAATNGVMINDYDEVNSPSAPNRAYCTDDTLALGLNYPVEATELPYHPSTTLGGDKPVVSLTKNLLEQMMYTEAGRDRIQGAVAAELESGSDIDSVTKLPFVANDTITFKVVLKPELNGITAQHSGEIPVNTIPSRHYYVTLICTDETVANTIPVDGADINGVLGAAQYIV